MKVEMMERPASVGNRLLAALPSEDLALLAPHLQKVSLKQDARDRETDATMFTFPIAAPSPAR